MKLKLTLILAALAAVVVAGCGSGSSGSSYGGGSSTQKNTAASTSSGSGQVAVSDNGTLGKILVDGQGRTLYLFAKDTGTTSTCTGACAGAWPPDITSGKPSAGSGAQASMLGTTKRSDGKTQVTYNGHPLYLYSGDSAAGDTNGQGVNAFGANWYAVGPAGSKVTGSGGSSSGGGSSGYGY